MEDSEGQYKIKPEFMKTYNLKGINRKLSRRKLFDAMEKVEEMAKDIANKYDSEEDPLWVVEFQPALPCAEAVRINSYIEGFLDGTIMNNSFRLAKVYPSVVKKYFEFPKVERSRRYKSNKEYAVEMVKEWIGDKKSMIMLLIV